MTKTAKFSVYALRNANEEKTLDTFNEFLKNYWTMLKFNFYDTCM